MTAQPIRRSLKDVTPIRAAEPAEAPAAPEPGVETPAPVVETEPAAKAEAAPAAPAKPRRTRRNLLIAALPIALAVGGGYMWATGGRYVGTEDAYVQQDRVSVMPQVSGQIASVLVGENDAVAAGQTLFTIDDSAYRSAVEEAQAKLQSARLEVEKLKAAYAQAQSEAGTARDALAMAETSDARQQKLLKSGVVPQATADEQRAGVAAGAGRGRAGREPGAERQGGARGRSRHRYGRASRGAAGAGVAACGGARSRAYPDHRVAGRAWSARPTGCSRGSM